MINWRPRFTLRTLAIAVTLVCAYLASWKMTADNNINNQQVLYNGTPTTGVPAPFIVWKDWYSEPDQAFVHYRPGAKIPRATTKVTRQYYVWIFGPKVELPFRVEWEI